MTTRDAVHAIVDDLDDASLEIAKIVLQEIRQDGFEITDAEDGELRKREEECARGETLNAREFLDELRREGQPDSNR